MSAMTLTPRRNAWGRAEYVLTCACGYADKVGAWDVCSHHPGDLTFQLNYRAEKVMADHRDRCAIAAKEARHERVLLPVR